MSLDYIVQERYRGREIIFDLDNTLFAETDFLHFVFQRIAYSVDESYQFPVLNYLIGTFKEEGRVNLFNKLVSNFPDTGLTIDKCLYIMRNSRKARAFSNFPWVYDYVLQTNSKILKIITNGNIMQQMNKVYSINWSVAETEVIYAKSIQSKPHELSYYSLNNWQNFFNPIYIGDSIIDEEFSHRLGIEFFDAKLLY